jgi:hypothetical protein
MARCSTRGENISRVPGPRPELALTTAMARAFFSSVVAAIVACSSATDVPAQHVSFDDVPPAPRSAEDGAASIETRAGSDSTSGESIRVESGTRLAVTQSTLRCKDLQVMRDATLDLTAATIVAETVRIESGGRVWGCGTFEAALTNDGEMMLGCSGGFQFAGPVTNNGHITIRARVGFMPSGPFINNGMLDLTTSGEVSLPATFVNNGRIIYPGEVKFRSVEKRGSSFKIVIESLDGHGYQLQRSLSPEGSGWSYVNAGSLQGRTGTDIILEDRASDGETAFYRVEVAP